MPSARRLGRHSIKSGISGVKVCIDINVFLNVLNRELNFYNDSKEVLNAIDQGRVDAVIPTLVIAEIVTGFYADNKSKAAEQFLSTILSNNNIRVVQLSVEIANSSTLIRARTGMRLSDCIIMSTALLEKVDYVVTNDRNFPDTFHGLHCIKPSELVKLL